MHTIIETKVAISRTLRILSIFKDIDKDMLMGEAISLLLIAEGETKDGGGLTVTDLSNKGDFVLASASRYMKSLSKRDRYGLPGSELISDLRDPLDDRRKILRLTSKGRRTIEQIAETIGG